MFTKFNTSNKSFIEMHHYLKNIGIKNNQFFLELKDESLEGIDPHDINLSDEMKAKIFIECKNNIWYFLREVVRLPYFGASVSLKLDRGILAKAYGYINNWNMFIEQPRCTYNNMATVCLYLWDSIFNYRSEFINNPLFISSNISESLNNIKKLDHVKALLPRYLIIAGYNGIHIPLYNHKCYLNIKNVVYQHPSIWIDNFAFLEENDKYISNTIPLMYSRGSYNFDVKKLHINEELYMNTLKDSKDYTFHKGIILTTTAADISKSEEALFAYEFAKTLTKFNESIYDTKFNCDNKFIHIRFTYKELGLDHKWYRERVLGLKATPECIKTEIDLNWSPWNLLK